MRIKQIISSGFVCGYGMSCCFVRYGNIAPVESSIYQAEYRHWDISFIKIFQFYLSHNSLLIFPDVYIRSLYALTS